LTSKLKIIVLPEIVDEETNTAATSSSKMFHGFILYFDIVKCQCVDSLK